MNKNKKINKDIAVIGTFTAIFADANQNIKYRDKIQNRVVNLGLKDILDVRFSGKIAAPQFVFITSTAYTANANDTMNSLLIASPEVVTYSESLRPQYLGVVQSTPIVTNTVSKAIFTFTAPANIAAVGISQNSAKGSNTGELFCFKNFPAVRSVVATDTLSIEYSITLVSA